MKSVFEQYKIPGKDKDGHPTEFDILTKEKAFQASQDIIMKWNDLPEQNAQKYLNEKFDKTWKKFDVNEQGFIDTNEAFQFERQVMGTNTLTDGLDTQQLDQQSGGAADMGVDDLLAGLKLWVISHFIPYSYFIFSFNWLAIYDYLFKRHWTFTTNIDLFLSHSIR